MPNGARVPVSTFLRRLVIAGAMLMITLGLSSFATGQDSEAVLYNFPGGAAGEAPQGLIFDASGNLYGTTQSGGANGFGTIFKVSPVAGGGWTETVLYSFVGGAGGQEPQGCLIFDAAGNLYGTAWGGTDNNGVVFKLTSTKNGWKETVLHTFTAGSDGGFPYSGLAIDAAGNLYGTTAGGGKSDCFDGDCGVVYKLSFVAGAGWKETVLHSFTGTDGAFPYATPLLDASGNLYGTTTYGGWISQKGFCGREGCGVVYKLSPTSGGWKETVLHTFIDGPQDGGLPAAGLVWDAAGNLYGATSGGGSYIICENGSGCGVVFELSPTANGTWTETMLHRFNGRDGAHPYGTPVFDSAGNLYGPTGSGGNGFGTAYELSPSSGGWVFNTLFSFGSGNEGSSSDFGFVLDHAGNLYGTSATGGNSNNTDVRTPVA